MNPPLYILAGGRSSRFGSDKARAVLDGVPLILRVSRALADVAGPTFAVADSPGKYANLGLETIADEQPHLGPLAGLFTALTHRREHLGAGWIILAACDLILVNPLWVENLAAAVHSNPTARALCFRDDRPQPLPGLYHTELIDGVRNRIDSGRLSLISLLEDAQTVAALLPVPADWPASPSINHPLDLAALAQLPAPPNQLTSINAVMEEE